MMKEYIEQRNGGYYIAGKTHIAGLYRLCLPTRRSPGEHPPIISPLNSRRDLWCYCLLPGSSAEVDLYLVEEEAEFEKMRQASREAYPEWYEKLDRARKEALSQRS